MAERLSEFPGRINASRRYPWDEWTDGSAWSISQDEDYTIKTSSMATMLYDYASRTHRRVRVTRPNEGNTLVFQFYAKEGE